MSQYYDRAGAPISDALTWARMFGSTDRRVGYDTAEVDGQKVLVSTVWLGLDHSFCGGPPLIFETMVFGGPLDQEQERYSTEDAAREGHARWVKRALGAA